MKRFRRIWSIEEQAMFLLRLGKLLDKGYSLSQALEFLEIQQPPQRKNDLQQCLLKLREGFSFHETLQTLRFHPEVLGYLYFAEQHGNLARGLSEAGNMLLIKVRYMNRLRKLSGYPFFLLCFMILLLIIIQQMLFPQFNYLSSTFADDDFSASNALIGAVSLIPSLFFVASLVIFCLIPLYFIWFKKLEPSVQMNILLKIPFLRTLAVLYHSQLFALQFSNLLNGGLSVSESLQVFERQGNLPLLQAEAAAIKEQLAKGEKLDAIIEARRCYEKELALVIRHGQSNGELAKELFHYSQFVMQRIEEKLEKWLRVIQPFLFSFVGMLVVLMYLAILLPMFTVINHL